MFNAMDHNTDTVMAGREALAVTQNDGVRDLLALASRLVDQGKPSQALQVMMVMQCIGGNEAVFQSLHRAHEMYRSRLQENPAVDQLASLFAKCVIAEVQSSNAESILAIATDGSVATNSHGNSVATDSYRNSILAETGRKQIVLDAFADGSSFICLQCGGIVSNHRKDEHHAYWCGRL